VRGKGEALFWSSGKRKNQYENPLWLRGAERGKKLERRDEE